MKLVLNFNRNRLDFTKNNSKIYSLFKMIFCFNPCHIFTVMQIYFLASRPTKWMHFLFHSQQPILFGTLLAMIFPETATRHHPLQKEIYWIQHLLIYTIPAQLMVCNNNNIIYIKVGCVFPMVICSEFRIEQCKDDDHRDDAPYRGRRIIFTRQRRENLHLFPSYKSN